MKNIDYAEVIERIKEVKKFKNDTALADFLGLTRQAIYGFKKTKVPLEIIIDICEAENVSLDWLLLGREWAKPESDIEKRVSKLEKKLK